MPGESWSCKTTVLWAMFDICSWRITADLISSINTFVGGAFSRTLSNDHPSTPRLCALSKKCSHKLIPAALRKIMGPVRLSGRFSLGFLICCSSYMQVCFPFAYQSLWLSGWDHLTRMINFCWEHAKKWSLKKAEWLLSKLTLSSLTTERIWLVYITHQAFALSELGGVNFIFINCRSLSYIFWILRWWALWKADYQWNLGDYVSLETLLRINRRQIQVLSFFWASALFRGIDQQLLSLFQALI